MSRSVSKQPITVEEEVALIACDRCKKAARLGPVHEFPPSHYNERMPLILGWSRLFVTAPRDDKGTGSKLTAGPELCPDCTGEFHGWVKRAQR